MSMGFRRKMALLMAGCLVFGSIQLTGLTVQASQTEDGAAAYVGADLGETVTDGNSVTSGDEGGNENNVLMSTTQDFRAGQVTYAAADLGAYERWSKTPVELTDGKMVLTFTKQYEEFCLDLPKMLDMSECESITFRTADQNGALCFKVYNAAGDELKAYYGNSGQNEYTFVPDFTGDAAFIGVMSNSEKDIYPFTSQVVSVAFKMNGSSEEEGNVKIYAAEDLKAYGRWSSSTQIQPTDGKMIFSFAQQWDEFCLDLPTALDMSDCENITIRTADQGLTLAFKVYNGAKDELKVYYNNSGKSEYSFTPDFTGQAACIGIMSSDEAGYPGTVQIVSLEFTMNGDSEEIPLGENLIQNPNFADPDDLGVWGVEQGSSLITSETAGDAVFDEVTTYGKITNRESNYHCFAQDITNVVQKNSQYQFTFYVKLDENDYKDASEEMRTVQMAPFIVSDGVANYSCNMTGDTSQVLEPGVWTKFTGTFTPSWTGTLDRVVMRILEQGTEYGSGPGVKGTYYATGVELREMILPKKEIQQDVPDLKEAVAAEMGDDFLMGVSIVNSELSDDLLMQLVTKHFNAVTLGNELKPDAMFGYASTCPGTETATINGQEIQVPTLNYSRAEATLNAIYDWNQEHPEDFIRIRGHVLVWHSQTPEWFFHQDYDAGKPYVDKDTMNLRLEWYIKTMAEHFNGPDSKYKDMFYGWDVVNEAVSDGTGTYRNDKENSSWWAVYQSNEFILNAFIYANRYMPANVELYYNDYNEWFTNKRNGIVQLLKDVKAAEGARIDGMGMQGHYQTNGSPTAEEFEAAARAYCEVVGKVQVTELDMAASSSYDGTSATLKAEYERQAKRYQEIYTSIRRLKEEGYKVGNITIWGVIDKNSWLQTSSSVGGGTDGKRKQCPLLFDDDYQVKPAYWVFVNVDTVKPSIHKLAVVQRWKEPFASGIAQSFARNGTAVSFKPEWSGNTISVQVMVADPVKDPEDKVTLYLTNADGSIVTTECLRTDAEETEGGYVAVLSRELDSSVMKTAAAIGFDIVVTNGSQKVAYNDTTLSQETSSEYYAVATLKPYTGIPMGTAVVDGVMEGSWDKAVTVPLTIRAGANADAQASLMWDQEFLYVFAQIRDGALDKTASQAHEQDSLEVFIDENNHKSAAYEEDDKQYRINYTAEQSYNGVKCVAENIVSAAKTTADGYVIEAAFKWTDIAPVEGMEIGLELQINDAEGGKRIGTLSWYDESGQGWSSPGVFGTARLVKDLTEQEIPEPTPEPTPEPGTPEPTPEPGTPEPTPEPGTPEPTPEPGTPEPTPGPEVSPKPQRPQQASSEITVNWDQVMADMSRELAVPETVVGQNKLLNVSTGRETVVPASVLQALTGKNLTLAMDTKEGLTFSINGINIPYVIQKADLDLRLSKKGDAIPDAVMGEAGRDVIAHRQISMASHKEFGMIVNMHLALGSENAGKYANLYRYDAQEGKLVYQGSFRIIEEGQAMFCISGGADYLVTVTTAQPNDGYIVARGDTLSRIASRYGLRVKDILAVNPQIDNKNRIRVGQKINLP